MVRTPDQVSQDIRNYLSLIDPSFTASLGTPERKIIDAVSESISTATMDADVATTMWDINTKQDIELDQFVGLFGFGRYAGRRSTGEVTLTLSLPAQGDTSIPAGFKVATEGTDVLAPVSYSITASGLIPQGETTITLPAQCDVVGEIGNTAANTIVQVTNSVGSSIFVANAKAFTGGTDPETDEELRDRFKETFMRNLAGTEDFYENLCLMYEYCSRVNVIGPISRYKEQLEFTKNGTAVTAVSQIQNSKYTWPKGEFVVKDKGEESELFLTRGVDYNMEGVIPPKFTSLNTNATDPHGIPEHEILDIEHEYTSTASRNDPTKLVTNKVDLYVDAQEFDEVYESGIVSDRKFVDTTTDPNYSGNFLRMDLTKPKTGNLFTPLGSCPISRIPDSIQVNGVVRKLGTDYVLVNDNTLNQGSPREISGIEWLNDPRGGATNVPFSIDYFYNRGPAFLQALIDENRQITTDVMVHEANILPVRVNLFVILSSGYSLDTAKTLIEYSLTDWASSLTFGDWIQLSDIEAVVHNTHGVDAVRVIRSGESSDGKYGLELLKPDGTINTSTTKDFRLLDSQILRFDGVNVTQKSTNTFGEQ